MTQTTTEETNLPKIVTATNTPGTPQTHFQTHFQIREHTLLCDEMPLYDGVDAGPDPYDLVIAGVGGCTAISLRAFAERKGWDIGEITIKLIYDSVDGEDFVKKEISFTGDLTDEQRAVLARVAHCTTQKMLERGMKFTNEIV